ncbi:hypothetical protein BDW68DRAFT_125288 [Aspergillus falconensis]
MISTALQNFLFYLCLYPNGVPTVLFFSVGPILTSKAPSVDGDRTAGCRYLDCPDKTGPGLDCCQCSHSPANRWLKDFQGPNRTLRLYSTVRKLVSRFAVASGWWVKLAGGILPYRDQRATATACRILP